MGSVFVVAVDERDMQRPVRGYSTLNAKCGRTLRGTILGKTRCLAIFSLLKQQYLNLFFIKYLFPLIEIDSEKKLTWKKAEISK